MKNSGTLVDRRLEAGHGDKVAIRYGDQQVTYAELHEPLPRRQRAGIARRRPRGPRADDPRRLADVRRRCSWARCARARCRRRCRFLDTTENFAHYARDSYAKLIVAEDALLERLPEGTMARSAFEAALASSPRRALARRHPPGRHGVLAVQRRLDRVPEGRRAPRTTTSRTRVRPTRARSCRSPSTTSRSPRPSSTTRTGSGTTSRSRTGWARRRCCGRASPTRRDCWRPRRRNRPTLFFSVPTLYGAMVNLPDAADHDLSSVRFCVSAAEPLAPEVLRRWQTASTSTSSTASARPRCCTSTAPTARATSSPGTSGKPVPGYELSLLDEHDQPVSGRRGRQPARQR